jgi:DNA polymerase elongation subunit (family B)
MDWAKFQHGMVDQGDENADNVAPCMIPPVPDESVQRGVLPRVIKTLVDRRRAVKKMLKTEKDPEKREEVSVSFERGVRPRVIKTLVDRRRAVKKMLKTEIDPEKREEVSVSFVVYCYS